MHVVVHLAFELRNNEYGLLSGDHGGESKAERTAALFAYSERELGDSSVSDIGAEVQQTDLAPTLSAALGRPPPAPSLGSLLLPVLPKMTTSHTLLHLTNNLKQVLFISLQ